jgi:hypothetical protein
MSSGRWQLEGTAAELYQRYLAPAITTKVGRRSPGSRATSCTRSGLGYRLWHGGGGPFGSQKGGFGTSRRPRLERGDAAAGRRHMVSCESIRARCFGVASATPFSRFERLTN